MVYARYRQMDIRTAIVVWLDLLIAVAVVVAGLGLWGWGAFVGEWRAMRILCVLAGAAAVVCGVMGFVGQ